MGEETGQEAQRKRGQHREGGRERHRETRRRQVTITEWSPDGREGDAHREWKGPKGQKYYGGFSERKQRKGGGVGGVGGQGQAIRKLGNPERRGRGLEISRMYRRTATPRERENQS